MATYTVHYDGRATLDSALDSTYGPTTDRRTITVHTFEGPTLTFHHLPVGSFYLVNDAVRADGWHPRELISTPEDMVR